MKKRFSPMGRVAALLLTLALFLTIATSPAKADSAAIHSIDTTVLLEDNGDAHITQVFDVTVTSGTEWYLVQDNMGDMEIEDFSVSENGRAFLYEGEWDIDRDIEEKQNRCGIVTKYDGYELCWGVGTYGRHTFTVSYTMTNMLKAYPDYDGFNVRFINDELSSPVQEFRITIEGANFPLKQESTRFWAFGFTGTILFKDGKVICQSTEPMSTYDYCNIMMRFEKDVFLPVSQGEGTFDDVVRCAFEGSDYDYDEYLSGNAPRGAGGESSPSMGSAGRYEGYGDDEPIDDWVFILIGIVCMVLPILIVPLILVAAAKQSKHSLDAGPLEGAEFTSKEKKDLPWVREVPFDGCIHTTYFGLKASKELENEGDLIGAYLLKWMFEGLITFEETPTKKFLGLVEKMQPSIVFSKKNLHMDVTDPNEKRLLKLMEKASGGDLILQEKEFYRYSSNHYSSVESFFASCERSGRSAMRSRGEITAYQKPIFFGLTKTKRDIITNKGRAALHNMLGFRKFLKDFTLVGERTPGEVALWDNYLIFATLFGIADEVAEQFSTLYPSYFESYRERGFYYGTDYDFYRNMRALRAISHAGHSGMSAGRAAASAASSGGSSGGGGFSSGGGGGGFSGGGSGGGSR